MISNGGLLRRAGVIDAALLQKTKPAYCPRRPVNGALFAQSVRLPPAVTCVIAVAELWRRDGLCRCTQLDTRVQSSRSIALNVASEQDKVWTKANYLSWDVTIVPSSSVAVSSRISERTAESWPTLDSRNIDRPIRSGLILEPGPARTDPGAKGTAATAERDGVAKQKESTAMQHRAFWLRSMGSGRLRRTDCLCAPCMETQSSFCAAVVHGVVRFVTMSLESSFSCSAGATRLAMRDSPYS